MTGRSLDVVSDGLRLDAGIEVPPGPRGVAILLHGIPSIAPLDPDDRGYPGLAERFAAEGWAAAWGDMRAARKSPGYFSIEGWVKDALALVEAARAAVPVAGPAVLLGSSAGGAVSAEAIRRGAPVDALVLLAAPAAWLSFADDPAEGVFRIRAGAGMELSPETLEDPAQWATEFEGVTTQVSIADVRVPVLVVHGTADDVVPVEHAAQIAAAAPAAQLEILEGAGHQLRRDERAVALVLRWLDSTFPRTQS
ncbi:MAG TPA: alpha/beta fold hydrolase [Actinomycetota bacterium]|nr:alpha/beta fold hydrolase [Actinomycetota bacterium]